MDAVSNYLFQIQVMQTNRCKIFFLKISTMTRFDKVIKQHLSPQSRTQLVNHLCLSLIIALRVTDARRRWQHRRYQLA
jgi:hypothetical protein